MEQGLTTLTELIGRLQTAPDIAYRMALTLGDEQWVMQRLVIDIFPEHQPLDWSAQEYSAVLFVGGRATGVDAASWLLNRAGSAMGYAFRMPDMQASVPWSRHPSHTHHDPVAMPWPHTRYQVESVYSNVLPETGFLVSDQFPFYANLSEAASQLLHDVNDPDPQWELPGEIVIVRAAHPEAWIDRVRFSTTSLTVRVDGSEVAGTRLQIRGAPPDYFDARPQVAGSATYALRRGIPRDLWVVLSRGNRWLDYFHLDQTWWPQIFLQHDPLMLEAPDLATQVEGALYHGEDQSIAFEGRLAAETQERVLHTIAAFANGEGGILLLGVESGTGVVAGLPGASAHEKDRLLQLAQANITPLPTIHLQDCLIDERLVIVVHVEQGHMPPYGVYPLHTGYFVRRGGTTRVAQRQEVELLAHRALQPAGSPPTIAP